jgi:ketosteroid isomerase-like protein
MNDRVLRTPTERDVATDPVALVRAMWDADGTGDIDGVLATMHLDVTWSPRSRPARTLYSGHDGIRRLREEIHRSRGILTVEVDDFIETDAGNVICRGRSTLQDGERTTVQQFEASYIIRDGLIVSVETRHIDRP